jgi:hypothetical protein
MTTWTTNDRDRVITYLDLTLDKIDAVENALTRYEQRYGVTAIVGLQTKLTLLDTYSSQLLALRLSADSGVTSQSVPGFYSYTRTAGSESDGLQNQFNQERQWVVIRLGLSHYATIGQGKVSRA